MKTKTKREHKARAKAYRQFKAKTRRLSDSYQSTGSVCWACSCGYQHLTGTHCNVCGDNKPNDHE